MMVMVWAFEVFPNHLNRATWKPTARTGPGRSGRPPTLLRTFQHCSPLPNSHPSLPPTRALLFSALSNDVCFRRTCLSQVPRGPAHGQNQGARGKGGVKEADALASTATPYHPHRAPRCRCVLHAWQRALSHLLFDFDCVERVFFR